MVLGDVVAGEAAFLRVLHELQLGLEDLVEGRLPPLDPVEDAELQRNLREGGLGHRCS